MAAHELTEKLIQQKVAGGKSYTLLHLLAGKPLPADENLVKQMQLDHLAYLFMLEQMGKISVFGPIINHERLTGLIIFNTTIRDEISQVMADDPYIKQGYMTFELFDFFSIPGQCIK